MDITPLIPKTSKVIQAYDKSGFKVSGEAHNGAVCIYQDQVKTWSKTEDASELSKEDFKFLETLEEQPEVLIIGTGVKMLFLKKDVRNYLDSLGLFPEAMDSGAACRTYNVLLSEGRSVCACLLPYK